MNDNGVVREAGRHLIRDWRLCDFGPSIDSIKNSQAFIKDLVALIKTHTPTENELPIERMPPSVYKSLLLAYEAIAVGLRVKNWLNEHPEYIIDIPTEDFVEVTDRGTQLPLLWSKCKPQAQTLELAKTYAEQAYSRLVFFLEAIKFTPKEIRVIRSRLAMAKTASEEIAVVGYIVSEAMEKQLNPNALGPIVREMQGYTNHLVRQVEDTPFTHLLLLAQTSRTEQLTKGRVDWNDWSAHVYAVHKAIDTIYEQQLAQTTKDEEEFSRIMKQLGGHDEFKERLEERQGELMDGCSIAHHAWDWLVQSYPTLSIKTVEKHAALCYGLVREVNQGVTPYNNSALAQFGGWKTVGSLSSPAQHYSYILRQVVTDPSLFILQSAREIVTEEALAEFDVDDGYDAINPLGEVAPGYHRFFVVLSSGRSITPKEHERIRQACQSEASTKTCILDKINKYDNYVELIIGIDAKNSPEVVIDDIIISTNSHSPFLRFHFFITNTHIPHQSEIDQYLKSLFL